MKPKRKGRPLLIAAAGVAFVSFANCEQRPVGNLRAPDNPPMMPDSGASEDDDAGTPATQPPDSGGPPIRPVGNLRPPG